MALTIGVLWAILAGVATNMILGMLWYGPLFGKAWLRGMGWADRSDEELEAMKKSAGPGYMVSMLTSAVAVLLLWFLFDWATDAPESYAPWLKGLVLGFTGWAAFYVPGSLTAIFFQEQKFSVWAIGAGYWGLLAMAWGAYVGLFH